MMINDRYHGNDDNDNDDNNHNDGGDKIIMVNNGNGDGNGNDDFDNAGLTVHQVVQIVEWEWQTKMYRCTAKAGKWDIRV